MTEPTDEPQPEAAPSRVPRLLLLLAGAVVFAAAWGLLVRMAIGLGRDAQDEGRTSDWVLMTLSTAAAVVCLLSVMLLLARAWSVWRGTVPATRAVAGRRRK